MFASLLSILSISRALVASGWQMTKMLARFYALVIPATAKIAISRNRKRSNRVDRYLVECGDWTLRGSIRFSGPTPYLSSLSLTKRTTGRGSTSTATTPELTAPPAQGVLLLPEELGRAYQP